MFRFNGVATVRRFALWGLTLGATLATVVASTNAANAQQGKKYAVLIGVSYYESQYAKPLPYVENDVEILAETLAENGFIVYPFCEKTVNFPNNKNIQKSRLPTKKNVEQAFEQGGKNSLKSLFQTKNSTLLVFFSGHGAYASKESDETFLFLRDSRTNDANTLLKAQKLRKMISQTKCERRLFLLDSCYAGGTRGVASADERIAYAERFEKSCLEGGVDGVATFASSDFYTKSDRLLRWVKRFDESQKKRDVSAFTYWLNEGLKGHADGALGEEPNDIVESDELFAYIEQNFSWMCSHKRHFQIPVIVASKDEKPFAVCSVLRRDYLESIDDLAEQIVTKAKILGKKEIFVDKFDVKSASVDLRKDQKEIDALSSFAEHATEQLRTSVRKKSKAFEAGTVLYDGGDAQEKMFIVNASVEARIDASREIVYAMTCNSFDDSFRQKKDLLNVGVALAAKDAPEGFLKGLALDDLGSAPMKLRIEARRENETVWQTRPIQEIGGERWVELNPGENYRVFFEPNGGAKNGEQYVCARLLIDGRNTLAQYEPYVEPVGNFEWQLQPDEGGENANFAAADQENETTSGLQEVVAPVVPLNRARFWVVDLKTTSCIDGFCDSAKQTNAAFRVVKADEKQQSAESDEDERGLIVLAFYVAARSRSALSDVMTEPGPRRKYSAIVIDGIEPGAPLSLTRVRYASAERLARLKEEVGAANGTTF